MLALAASPGHFDELRGAVAEGPDGCGTATLASHWTRFFEALGPNGFEDLERRRTNLRRQVRDNGITYNVYADVDGPQRPWSLDLFPLILTADCWTRIERGVLQRMRLLEAILNDVYGDQEMLRSNVLPPALVHGHPGYLRPMHGVSIPGARRLHIAAFDLARDPSGQWWVMAQKTQAPSGLGYLLENRLIVSRLFPQAYQQLRVQRLAATYRALLHSLTKLAPCDSEPRVVLLTPGPYNETYFEHAYLARYLGLTLVEGSDLTVRGERLYLKTLKGLEPVHALLKRLDDEFLDPLELRADSHLGVPGLLQAIRAGNVLVANVPGSGFLESPAILGFLPAVSKHALGEDLQLPSWPTWWCGERAALDDALPKLSELVIQSTYATPGSDAIVARQLTADERLEWTRRLMEYPDDFTLQASHPLSQMPTWSLGLQGGHIHPRSAVLRVFAVSNETGGWSVLPGGLTRIASESEGNASMQRKGSSADTWVMTNEEVDRTTLLVHDHPSVQTPHRSRPVTSRSAENLFWLGRYTERTENSARLAKVILEVLNGDEECSEALLEWIWRMAIDNTLVGPGVSSPSSSSGPLFEDALVRELADADLSTSVAFNLRAMHAAASAVRERLSREHWKVVTQAEREFRHTSASWSGNADYSTSEVLRSLESLSVLTAAITGAQADRMTRDDGWVLLSLGRHIERMAFLAKALSQAIRAKIFLEGPGFEAVLAVFDSTITFHALYQQRRDLRALLDLLVMDRDNPRSVAGVAQSLREQLIRLTADAGDERLIERFRAPDQWTLDLLCTRDAQGRLTSLQDALGQCANDAYALSDMLTATYFAHAAESGLSIGS